MSDKSLFELNEEYLELSRTIEEQDGELTEEQFERFQEIQNLTDDKLYNYCHMIKRWEAAVEDYKERKKNLNRAQRRLKNSIRSFEYALSQALLLHGKRKVDLGDRQISHRKSKKVLIDDEEFSFSEDNDYIEKKVTYRPDKKKIKDAIERGENIRGAYLEEKENIQIK